MGRLSKVTVSMTLMAESWWIPTVQPSAFCEQDHFCAAQYNFWSTLENRYEVWTFKLSISVLAKLLCDTLLVLSKGLPYILSKTGHYLLHWLALYRPYLITSKYLGSSYLTVYSYSVRSLLIWKEVHSSNKYNAQTSLAILLSLVIDNPDLDGI